MRAILSCMGTLSLISAAVTFSILKSAGSVDWSWWIVLSPLIILAVLSIVTVSPERLANYAIVAVCGLVPCTILSIPTIALKLVGKLDGSWLLAVIPIWMFLGFLLAAIYCDAIEGK